MKKVLFLHIPKTSGISLKRYFKGAIEGFYIQADSDSKMSRQDPLLGRVADLADIKHVLRTHGGLALHVDFGFDELPGSAGYKSVAPVLFDPANAAYFKQLTILAMVREPLSRFLSEYTSLMEKRKNDANWLPHLDMNSVEGHVDRSNANALLHFLLEAKFEAGRQFSSQDVEHVKRCILDYPIHVGIYERYDQSIEYLSRVLGREFRAPDIPRLNVTKTPPPVVTPALAEVFRRKNQLDYELYDFALQLFETRAARPSETATPAGALR